MVKVVITAPRGAMDSLIIQEAYKNEKIEVIGCVAAPGRDYIGKDAGQICGLGFEIGAPIYDDLEADVNGTALIDLADVVVDYSTVKISMETLEKCVVHKTTLLCGTTGFSDEQLKAFAKASKGITLMQTADTSYVVTVMKKLLRTAAQLLEEKAGIEIIDAHSETKLDAPSGTAIELAEEMAEGMENRGLDDITFHSIRAGNTPSSHHVLFGCQGEMLKITHDAYDWRCFASGAIDAILFLAERSKAGQTGSYSMFDVIEK